MTASARGAIMLVVSGLGVALGYLRGLRALLTIEPEARGRRLNYGVAFTEPYPLLGFIVALISACLLLGLFPELLIEPLRLFSQAIGFPIPGLNRGIRQLWAVAGCRGICPVAASGGCAV